MTMDPTYTVWHWTVSWHVVGLIVMLEKMTAGIVGSGRVTGLEFKDGETLDTDMVVISCGIRANSEIA